MKSKYNRFCISNKEKTVFCRFNFLFMLIFVMFFPACNNFLLAQEDIVKEAAEAFMDSRKLMVFSEEYDKDIFENMLKNVSKDSTKTYLESIIDQNPNSVTSYHNLGIVYLLEKSFSKASKNLKAALNKDACLVNASIGLAIIHTLNERPQKAIKSLEDAMDCNHNTSDLQYWKGVLLIENGKFKESLLELNKTIKANPQNFLYVYSRAYVFSRIEADRKAIADYTRSYELNSLESKNYQGKSFFKKNQIEWEPLLNYFKSQQETLTWEIRELLEAGVGSLLRRNWPLARNKFKQALKSQKQGHPLIYYLLGFSSQSSINCKESIAYYNQALRLDSNIYGVLRNRGLSYLTSGNSQKALEDFEELIRLKPHFYISYREKSKALMLKRDWKEVIKTCNKALQLDSSDNEVFLNRGKAFRMLKQPRKALEDYDYILQRTEGNTSVFLEKGNAHLALGEYKEALIACDSILNISPNSPKVHNLRGVVYMNRQKYEEALACFDKSILLSPYYLEAHFNRALINFQFKNYVNAFRDINKVINLNNKNAEYYYLRAAIKKELQQKTACKDVQKALEMGMYLEKKEVERICE